MNDAPGEREYFWFSLVLLAALLLESASRAVS